MWKNSPSEESWEISYHTAPQSILRKRNSHARFLAPKSQIATSMYKVDCDGSLSLKALKPRVTGSTVMVQEQAEQVSFQFLQNYH
jgi:hypothetical protein